MIIRLASAGLLWKMLNGPMAFIPVNKKLDGLDRDALGLKAVSVKPFGETARLAPLDP